MYPTYLVLLVSENIAVSDQMPGEADPQQVEETNIKLQVNANSQGNTTQCEPLKGFFVCVKFMYQFIYQLEVFANFCFYDI